MTTHTALALSMTDNRGNFVLFAHEGQDAWELVNSLGQRMPLNEAEVDQRYSNLSTGGWKVVRRYDEVRTASGSVARFIGISSEGMVWLAYEADRASIAAMAEAFDAATATRAAA